MGLARKLLKRFALGRNLLRAQKLYRADQKNFQGVLPGHFYSPIPDHEEIRRNSARIFDRSHKRLPGIELREAEQLECVADLAKYYPELPFDSEPSEVLRAWLRNDMFAFGDAIFLYSMLRHLRPRRIVEVGSGFSSAVILDTNELFFDRQIECTFIEPYPERLHRLITDDDRKNATIFEQRVQDVEASVFDALEAGDILFVDSSHVSKIGSDVNHILFDVLPALKPGVVIHFHDITYPFEYLPRFFSDGLAWNEAYALRTFLQYNSAFEIVVWGSFLECHHRDLLGRTMPLCLESEAGSIWLRRK